MLKNAPISGAWEPAVEALKLRLPSLNVEQ